MADQPAAVTDQNWQCSEHCLDNCQFLFPPLVTYSNKANQYVSTKYESVTSYKFFNTSYTRVSHLCFIYTIVTVYVQTPYFRFPFSIYMHSYFHEDTKF